MAIEFLPFVRVGFSCSDEESQVEASARQEGVQHQGLLQAGGAERVKTRNQLHTISGSLSARRLLAKCSLIERAFLVQEINQNSELEGAQPELNHREPEDRLEDQKPVGGRKLKRSTQPRHPRPILPRGEQRSTNR